MTFNYFVSNGRLQVTVCANDPMRHTFSDTSETTSAEIKITCTSAVQISFTAVRNWGDRFLAIDDITVFERIPSTVDPATTSTTATTTATPTTSTTTAKIATRTRTTATTAFLPTTYPSTIKPSIKTTTTTQQPGIGEKSSNSSAVVIPVVVVVVIAMVVIIVGVIIVYRRRRKGSAKEGTELHERPTSPADKEYTNPAFSSGTPRTGRPDLVRELDHRAGPHQANSYVDSRVQGSSNLDGAYTDLMTLSGAAEISPDYQVVDAPDEASNPGSPHKAGLSKMAGEHTYQSLNRRGNASGATHSGALDVDSPEYNVIELTHGNHTEGQPSTDAHPASSEDQTYNRLNRNGRVPDVQRDDNYGATSESYDEQGYSALDHGPSVDDATKPGNKHRAAGPGVTDDEYGHLDLVDGDDNQPPSTPGDNAYNVIGGGTLLGGVGSHQGGNGGSKEQVESAGAGRGKGPEARRKGQGGRGHAAETESEYHAYQDLTTLDAPGRRPAQEDALYGDDYNVLHSGKETGDYHTYQDAAGVTANSKGEDAGDYSSISDQRQMEASNRDGVQHEPLYSAEIYSEFA